jgi:peptide subunit release factor 1 (eRF1)
MVPTANPSSSRKRTAGARKPQGSGESTVTRLIEQLTGVGVTRHWVVSCYLKLEPRDRARGKYLIKLKNRAKRLTAGLESRGLTRSERAEVEADVDRIRDYLSHPGQLPPGRGIALFACGPIGLFEVAPLPLVFRSRLVVDHSPLVRELAALDSEFGRVICASYDRTTARFFEVSAGGVTELPQLVADDSTRTARFHGPSKARQGRGRGDRGRAVGPSAPGEHNFNQRIREEKQRHYAGIAQRLFEHIRERPVRGIVLAGAKADVAGVEPHLHPYVAEALLGMARLNPKTVSEPDVLEAVLDLRAEMEREWERHHLAELDEGAGTGWAVNGVNPTLGALARGQVRTLLVEATAERPGFRCREDGRLTLSATTCTGEAEPVPDIIDEAIEEALRQGAHVDVVEDAEVRQRVDGLACLLRFRLP